MSEAPNLSPTSPSGVDASAPAPGTPAASLYPDGGGQGGSAAEPVSPAGDVAAPTDPAGDVGSGADTQAGADTSSGTDTSTEGADKIEGEPGADALTPESYTLSLPEGFVADPALMTEAAKLFSEIGVDPTKAQRLVDFYASASKAVNDAATTAHATQQTAWTTEINSMPEFQGEARATSLQAIGKVFDEYGTPEARTALDTYGTGNNPALVKMFLKMSAALSEGVPTGQGQPRATGADGRPASLAGKSVGQRLYPDQTPS